DRAHNHDVARDDEDNQPAWNGLRDAERDIDGNQHGLIGERIEVGTQFGSHAEPLGEISVDRVADTGGEEQHESDGHLAGHDGPDHDRHQKYAAKRNEIWNAQLCAPARSARDYSHSLSHAAMQPSV